MPPQASFMTSLLKNLYTSYMLVIHEQRQRFHMRNYYQVRLGKANVYAEDGLQNKYVGVGWFATQDLSSILAKCDQWKDFNRLMLPVYLEAKPETKKVAAGLFCGFTYTVCKGIKEGDLVLSPSGNNQYLVGEVVGPYKYVANHKLPHQREINWFKGFLDGNNFSEELRNSLKSIGTVSNVSKYAAEIEGLVDGKTGATLYSSDENVEDPSVFALEKHLEDFLIANWSSTELANSYDIFTEEGELVGQQYPTDTGPIDILAISKDKTELLVIELKKGRVSDVVVGQIQRYMGYVKDELAEPNQSVKGLIIGLRDDLKLKRALSAAQGIDFYRYKIDFKLLKGFDS